MNNVGALALRMPGDVQAAAKAKRSPALTLMPLSFATILGGLVTLIGTPPNIIISSYREQALGEPFSMFDFSPAGAACAIAGVLFGDAEGRLVYDPAHPLADEDGMVRHPDMNLSDQMTNLIIAQRAYQANVTVFERARDAYLRGLEIGR